MAAAAAPATMDAYLEQTLGFAIQGMREKIISEGFRDLDRLVKRDKEWVKSLRLSIKKSATGQAIAKNITIEQGELLYMTVLWARVRYLTQRPMTYADATLQSITAVFDWYEQQEEELPVDSVTTFPTTTNRRDWFESILSYLAAKKGKAGVPLNYVVSTTGVIDPAVQDPGFGLPSFDEDLAKRTLQSEMIY
jgi:hypothetical protein